jgi:DMSO reductase anchor subunit
MKPTFSVVAFTVLSGAGLGALALLCLLDVAALAGLTSLSMPPREMARAAAIALAFVAAGLSSSVLHLANPKNAWRAATRWRTSWLSREAIVSMALLAFGASYAAAWFLNLTSAVRVLLSAVTLLCAWGTLLCTAMIYASLKPIRQWHTWRVPVNYLLLGHASGALLVAAIARASGLALSLAGGIAGVLLVLAAIARFEYLRYVAGGVGAITLEQAIGVPQGVGPKPVPGRQADARSIMSARLFDSGNSRGTFLTREFLAPMSSQRRIVLLSLMWACAFALPIVWLIVAPLDWPWALLAVVACIIGLLAERWLFFADARHTVRLFHGDRRT